MQPKQPYHQLTLTSALLSTPLGTLIAVADENHLLMLDFQDRNNLEKLKVTTQAKIIPGNSSPLKSITEEIGHYFSGSLSAFKTPIKMNGSPFQKSVWEVLLTIPYGETRSYKQEAELLGRIQAYRAVANANGANPLAIIIPCHRIINANGKLGGYSGGLKRKLWLLDHEKKYRTS